MVSNYTIDLINYSKELDYSYNIKLLLILTFIAYAFFTYYIDSTYLKKDKRASMKLLSLGFKIYYIAILIYIPRFILLLTLDEDIGFLMLIQTYIYSIGAYFAIIILALYLLERLFKDYLGIEITLEGLKLKSFKRKYMSK